jgi:hypothetical protein
VVFEFTGHASDMAQVIMGRLVGAEDFALHEQLMVKGEMDNGWVQVVWTPKTPKGSRASDRADGTSTPRCQSVRAPRSTTLK